MKLLLDTHLQRCTLVLVDGSTRLEYDWLSDRDLAHHLHKFIFDKLAENNKTLQDLDGIGVFEGPGSFTGLRIGASVANSLAESLGVSVVGARGENWQNEALEKLLAGQNEKMVLPFYGAEARITSPKK